MGNNRRTRRRAQDRPASGRHARVLTKGRLAVAAGTGLLAVSSVVWFQSGHQSAQAGPAVADADAKPASVSFTGGALVYRPDAAGTTIPDFSSAGYGGGGVALPRAAEKTRLDAQAKGDDTARIQAAVDRVAQLKAGADGTRGAVTLGPGTFRVRAGIALADGVVLRGSGTGPGGTLLRASGKPGSLITIGGGAAYTSTGKHIEIADARVPVGATKLSVADASSFTPGDRVVVQRPTTTAWIKAIGMDKIDGGEGWKPNSGILAVRTVTAVSANSLTFDAPLTTAIEKRYGGGTVWHYALEGQVTHAGVENLAADATAFTEDADYGRPDGGKNREAGAFASRLLTIGAARDVWATDVRLTRFGSGFYVDDNASRVTIERAADLDMAVPAKLAPPPAFMIGGQQVLVRDTTVTGDRVHAWTTQAYAAGPNVFTRGTATSPSGSGQIDAGPHMRWGSGTLYDQLTIVSSDGAFIAANAWDGGTGHGWQGANNVFWNTSSARYTVLAPPTADNWAFGITGKRTPGKHDGELPVPPRQGTIVSPGAPVQPASLYEEQLRERR
ncbi:hypothetical protein ACFWAR_11395 [Streptomyces sp. NPDC059917]|uniref:hypothetical protein n=1 Tax=Streptomyces sp. NPDC059917 TaxID=3347002 RepID=UPI0036601D62